MSNMTNNMRVITVFIQANLYYRLLPLLQKSDKNLHSTQKNIKVQKKELIVS